MKLMLELLKAVHKITMSVLEWGLDSSLDDGFISIITVIVLKEVGFTLIQDNYFLAQLVTKLTSSVKDAMEL